MRRTLDSHSRRRAGAFLAWGRGSRSAPDPGEPTLGAIAERLILDHVVDTGETTTSTTYYEPRYQWSGGISPERLSEGPATANSLKIFLDTSSSRISSVNSQSLRSISVVMLCGKPRRTSWSSPTARGVRHRSWHQDKHLAEPLLHKVKALGSRRIGRQGQ
jgi:hypothetical protein